MKKADLPNLKKREENRPQKGSFLQEDPSREQDHELVRRAQAGENTAVTELYGKYYSRVFSYLYRFTGNRAMTEDLVQETFIRAVQHLPRYRPTGSVAGWIYRIAGNLALNSIRKAKTARELSLEEELETAEGETFQRSDTIASSNPGPSQQAQADEAGDAVQQALLKIAPAYRQAVILCDIQGYAYKEAADLLSCSINTVASRLARGRSQLASLLGYLRQEEGR